MSVLLHFMDGQKLELTVDANQWTEAFKKALRSSDVLEVRDVDGRRLGVNPQAVLYWTVEATNAPRGDSESLV
jgi:hypothetical protein